MLINEHLLTGDHIKHLKTPNTSGAFSSGLPDTLVIHFTAGGSAESSANYLCKESAKASAHVVIGRDGKIIQLAPFNIITWHAGKSSWKGRTGLNKYSIGIELDNAGNLTPNGNGQYLSWFNKAYAESDVFRGTHRNQNQPSFWHAYTEIQIDTTFELCQLLCDHYSIEEIVGHEEISPGRKVDPGPAFPLDKLRQRLLLDSRDLDEPADTSVDLAANAMVDVTKLNIRSGPGTQYSLAADPLRQGTLIKPLQTVNGWTEVEYTVKGWVSSRYIKPVS